jgi:hypothetical protein
LIRAGFHNEQGLGEHERGGASSALWSRCAGPVASKPSVHQCWPPVRTSVSSTSHPRSWPSRGARATICPLARENRLIRRLLVTGLQPGGPPLPGLSG